MRTGSRRIVCNTWSDAARQAAIAARKEHATGGAEQQPYSKLGMKDKAQYHDSSENYKRLSPKERAQFQKDYADAHAASTKANAEPTKANHQAAATAHTKASKSAPSPKQTNFHKAKATYHAKQAGTVGTKPERIPVPRHGKDVSPLASFRAKASNKNARAAAYKVAQKKQATDRGFNAADRDKDLVSFHGPNRGI